jgi:hypothetical protein
LAGEDRGTLRVLIHEHRREWFAEAIELDYAASGWSLEDAKRRFKKGLAATIALHLGRYGNVENLLRLSID